jgi:hypothetical protein
MVELLRAKEHNIYIWCFAKTFVSHHGLKGFCCDMFVSEVQEAAYVGLWPVPSEEEVQTSNSRFCQLLGECISDNSTTIHTHVTREYGVLAATNVVAAYNHARLGLFRKKYLIIHPLDASTTSLDAVYAKLPAAECTVIQGGVNRETIM